MHAAVAVRAMSELGLKTGKCQNEQMLSALVESSSPRSALPFVERGASVSGQQPEHDG
jgi:hypothetical protein